MLVFFNTVILLYYSLEDDPRYPKLVGDLLPELLVLFVISDMLLCVVY